MTSPHRSFRFFGNFGLFDVVSKRDVTTAFNTLEFFHMPQAKSGALKTFVRFSKFGTRSGAKIEAPQLSQNIFNPAAFEGIVDSLKDGQQPVSFWVCKATDGAREGGHRLRIRKAICMDQFADPAAKDPTARYPLCAEFTQDGEVFPTNITLGQGDSGFDIRFELGFPSLWENTKGGPGIAFGGVFKTTAKKADKFTKPFILLLGPEGKTEIAKSKMDKRLSDYFLAGKALEKTPAAVPFGAAHENTPDLYPFIKAIGLKAKGKQGETWLQMRSSVKGGEFTFAMGISQQFSNVTKSLDLSVQLGAKLPLKTFTAEVYWKVKLANYDIELALAGAAGPIPVETVCQIRWQDTIGKAGNGFARSGILQGAGLAEVARMSNGARNALIATDRQPQSILPELSNIGALSRTIVPLIGYPNSVNLSFELGKGPYIAPRPEPRAVNFAITLDTGALAGSRASHPVMTSAETPWLYSPAFAKPLELHMRLPAFNDVQQALSTPELHHHIRLGFNAESQNAAKNITDISIMVGNGPRQKNQQFSARLGSLAFTGGDLPLLAQDKPSLLSIRRRDQKTADVRTPPAPALDIAWQLCFGLETADPVTTDTPHGERGNRSGDILVSEPQYEDKNKTQNQMPSFTLLMSERLRDDQDRHLIAELFDTSSAEGAAQAYTVISTTPFSAYRYIQTPLASSGDAQSSSVAHFDSDERVWRLKRTSDTYLMVRPPGATGEDADKPGRLEVHDAKTMLDDATSGDEKAPLRPALAPKNGVSRNRALKMRLSPHTKLWVEPSDLARNYYLPGYAGRDLFRQQGDFGLGMALAGLRTELVYGLSTGVAVPPPSARTPAPRVAELEALTGKPFAADEHISSNTVKRWGLLREGFEHRAERLEISALDPARTNPFVPVRFKKGLQFSLRNTALMAPPVKDDNIAAIADSQIGPKPVRFKEQGLSGGALWPLESANIARVLAENPVGTGGTLEGVALSPMGDSGDQTVRFLNTYASIITETRAGRLQKHRVEVMGRISALWHRAKHVVIYERTTASSAQFTPDQQPTRTRRPVLRKVEEFIEILEPVRRYPDTKGASSRGRGFLEEVRFNARIIHVNSAWGQDVGDFGWEVPLWNRGEAATRPQIYPYPDVAFVTASEGGSGSAQAAHECLDVANLYFYTDPVAALADADSDNWPARQGVDFSVVGNRDSLGALLKEVEAETEEGARRPAATRVLPGLARFSWRLAPSPLRTRLNEGRSETPIFAGIESVSLMRGPMRPNKGAIEELLAIVKTGKAVSEVLNGASATFKTKDAVKTALDNITGNGAVGQSDLAKLKAALTLLEKVDIAKRVNNDLGSITGKITGKLPAVSKAITFDTAACDRIANNASAAIRGRKLLILRMVRQAEAETIPKLEGFDFKAKDAKQKLKALIFAETTHAMRDIFAQASTGIGDLSGGITTTRAIVADWRANAIAAQSRALARIADLSQAYDRSKPWSRNRIEKALGQLQGAFETTQQDALDALEETRLRFAHELDNASQDLGALVTAGLQLSLQSDARVQQKVGTVNEALIGAARSLNTTIAKLPGNADIKTLVDKLKAKKNKKLDEIIKTLEGLDLGKTKTVAIGLVNSTTETLAEDANSIGSFSTAAKNDITKALASVKTANSALKAALGDVLADTDAGLKKLAESIQTAFSAQLSSLENMLALRLKPVGLLDQAVHDATQWLTIKTRILGGFANDALGRAEGWLEKINTDLGKVSSDMAAASKDAFFASVIDPAITEVVGAVNWRDVQAQPDLIINEIRSLADQVEATLERFGSFSGANIEAAEALCKKVTAQMASVKSSIETSIKEKAESIKTAVQGLIDKIDAALPIDPDYIKEIVDATQAIVGAVDQIQLQVQQVGEHAQAYLNRGAGIIDQIHSAKATELPGLALQLVSAATQAPEIAAFKTNADRIRLLFDEATDIIETSPLKGMLDQLGDALKSLGLDFNFSQFSDSFKIDLSDKSNLLRGLIPSFGGIDITKLLPSARLPSNLDDAVKITHDLDIKAGRAWVQIDVDVPLPGREPMFSLGPFTLYLTKSTLTAFLRAVASKEQENTSVTDKAVLSTTLEAVVAGQVMVTLKDVKISYSSAEKLKFDIDPSKIKIHSSMRFIQDTLGALFGDGAGGLKFIKENGVPVGVEHQFALPSISLMYGTSGIQFLKISNRFSLRAYPDFVIANRFNLSRRDVPFLFSVFIIGGTGYIQVDTEYRPFDGELMVMVEAGAGGSASLGFAFGPVNGGVYITLSIVLRYQKRIGNGASADDGLSVSLVLVIGGSVSLWGLVTVQLSLSLAISYHESGRMDGLGQLSVTVRISKWFKLRYATQVKYTLRNGQSTRQISSNTEISGKAVEAAKKLKKLDKVRTSL